MLKLAALFSVLFVATQLCSAYVVPKPLDPAANLATDSDNEKVTAADLKNLEDALSSGYLDGTLDEEERRELGEAIHGGYLAAVLDIHPEDELDGDAPREKRGGFLDRIKESVRKIGRDFDDRVLQPAKDKLIDGWMDKAGNWLQGKLFD